MAEEVKTENTQATADTPVAAEKTEQTVDQIIDTVTPKKEEPQTIGLDKFLELKKQNKELEKSVKALTARIDNGDDAGEIADDIQALATEHDVDPGFLKKLVKSIESKAEKSIDDRINAKLAPITEEKKAKDIDNAFQKHFNIAIEQMPEYKDIVNPEVIKSLSLDPKNRDKTFSQIIEDTYGNAVTGKRTIERTTPGGGKEPTEIDYDKAKADPAYFKEVMANPSLKKKYNEGMVNRLSAHL